MNTKSIVFTSPCKAELLDENTPSLTEKSVLTELFVSTISSGTERANLVGDKNVAGDSKVVPQFPRRCGYSSSGIVKEVGSAVTKVKTGDRVALSWSTHTKYCVIDESNVSKLNDDVSFSDGAILHIATFPAAAVRKCHLEFGESAMVMGLGVLGLVSVKLLKLAGAVPIIAVDPVKEKREKALALGADYALDPFEENFSQKVKELTNGGARVAIEVTGNGPALDSLLDCVCRFARVALLGCTRDKNFTIDYYKKVHYPGVSLIGAHTLARPGVESFPGNWTTSDDIFALQKLISGKRLCLSDMVDEIHSSNEASSVYERLANEKSFPLVQFDWRK